MDENNDSANNSASVTEQFDKNPDLMDINPAIHNLEEECQRIDEEYKLSGNPTSDKINISTTNLENVQNITENHPIKTILKDIINAVTDDNKISNDNIDPEDFSMKDGNSEIELISRKSSEDIVNGKDEFQSNGNIDTGQAVTTKDPLFFKDKSLLELARYSWGNDKQSYLNGCAWSPDGTCILSSVNGDGMHLVELPNDLYNLNKVDPNRPLDVLRTAVHIKNGGTVYDYCWYPFMNSSAPETCCWISTRQHAPIQMWDAFDGSLRCSYRGFDAVDEVEAAISLVFTSDGTQVIGGYRKCLKIFRTDVPGRDFTNIPTKFSASCLATTNSDLNTLAIGSWNCTINIIDLRCATDILHRLIGHKGGITHIKFLDSQPQTLLTGARKDNKLLLWDLRFPTIPVIQMARTVETNQTIYFDVSSSGQWLTSGDTNGDVHVWDLNRPTIDGKLTELKFQLHNDCCNGVSFHPSLPILATSSGQYHFDCIEDDNEDETLIDLSKSKENSLIIWWHG